MKPSASTVQLNARITLEVTPPWLLSQESTPVIQIPKYWFVTELVFSFVYAMHVHETRFLIYTSQRARQYTSAVGKCERHAHSREDHAFSWESVLSLFM